MALKFVKTHEVEGIAYGTKNKTSPQGLVTVGYVQQIVEGDKVDDSKWEECDEETYVGSRAAMDDEDDSEEGGSAEEVAAAIADIEKQLAGNLPAKERKALEKKLKALKK